MNNNDYLTKFALPDNAKAAFKKYYEYLIEENKKINLTSITLEEEVYIKHFYDSLLLSQFIKDSDKVADVGTGAGFPGVPLLINNPKINLTLIEPTTKRTNFLNRLLNELKTVDNEINLDNVRVINKRSEDASLEKEIYDVAIARAVAPLNILLEIVTPLLKVNGIFFALKGINYNEELIESTNALRILNLKINAIHHYSLPNDLGERTIIEIKKIKKTPNIYPRIYAKIKKEPL